MKIQLPASAKNWLSLTGAIIAVTALFMIVFLFIIAVTVAEEAPYLGLVTYILLPSIMILGLLLIPLGMWREVRRRGREGAAARPGWPKIDLEEPRHRHAFFIFVIGTGIFLLLSSVGSYQAFHYTESVQFCGTLCHKVMEPEHTAHSNSPHAKVACVSCHVGPGAGWYARSKLSGMYQVYAVIAGVYPRPIPTPIKNLRPARAVCEQCHWPQNFYGHKLELRNHYLSDEANTPWRLGLNMKVGPAQSALGVSEGIHWHIHPNVRVEYGATDPGRQEIPWVRLVNLQTGSVKLFRDHDARVGSGQEKGRVMDCIDCHNRPSHLYRPPARFIDNAMTAGRIPANLPGIKKLSLELASASYDSKEKAMQGISDGIVKFYQSNHPELLTSQRPLVDRAVKGLQTEFAKNIFPYMKVNWRVYPDNIGHLYYKGCFRCHNGTHRTESGETISRDCALCHDIVIQGGADSMETGKIGESLAFRHPEDIGDAWKETLCSDCHTGGAQ
jgi:hypothetical protein